MGTSGLWLLAQNPGDSLDLGLVWGRVVLGDRLSTCGSDCVSGQMVSGSRGIVGAQPAWEGCVVGWGKPHTPEPGAEPFKTSVGNVLLQESFKEFQ